MYSQEEIKRIIDNVDIVDVISSYIELERKGSSYVGLCPFHDDHHSSMSVSKDRKIYKCFSCNETGNVIKFVQNYEKVTFKEACDILSQRYNLGLVKENVENNPNQKLYEIMEKATLIFQNNLNSKEGLEAKEYLKNRKLDSELIKEFRIGLSLKESNSLTKQLSKTYTLEELNSVDVSYDNNDSYINRIVFPLEDRNGKVIGFSGRIYHGEDMNKYRNSKETPLFRKSEVLFNYHRAKDKVRETNSVIVMEGFMAVIRAYSVGIKNCIATMGTNLAKEQLQAIKRLSNNVILCYDGDNAGREATLKNIESFYKSGVNVKVIELTDNLDPDDYIIKYGESAFQRLIENVKSYADYLSDKAKNKYNLSTVSGKEKYIEETLTNLAKEKQNERNVKKYQLRCEILLKDLEKDTGVWYNSLRDRLFEIENGVEKELQKAIKTETPKPIEKLDKYYKAMHQLLYCMLNSKEAITLYDESNILLPDNDVYELANRIIDYYKKFNELPGANIYSIISDDEKLQELYHKIEIEEYPDNFDKPIVLECLKAISGMSEAIVEKKYGKNLKEETDINKRIAELEKIRLMKAERGKKVQ